jgi:hypothetical protein
MLSDPISVTYDATATNLPRTSPKSGGTVRLLGQSGFNTADGEFDVSIKRTEHSHGRRRTEIILSRTAPDSDGPFVGNYPDVRNSFGVVFESNALTINTSVDVPKLRTALLAFLDTPMTNRLLGGEL